MKPFATVAGRWAAVCLTIFTLTAASAWAEKLGYFDLETTVDSAELIVLGQLDPEGNLAIREVIAGDPVPGPLRIENGAATAGALQPIAKVDGPLEVVGFLATPKDGKASAPRGMLGFAALKGDAVFTVTGRAYDELYDDARLRDRRDTFLAGIRAAFTLKRERGRIVALPRGPERTGAMIAFLRERVAGEQPPPRNPRTPSVHVHAFALALKDPTADETAALVAALQEERAPVEQAELVKLAGLIPLGPEGFAAVASLTARNVPTEIRHVALDALPRMNYDRAIEVLIPLLSLDEPELITVLQNFGVRSYPPQDGLLSLRAVDALEQLALEMRRQHALGDRQALANEGYALLAQLAHYYHPRLLAILVDWALADDHVTSNQALSELRSLTGLTFQETDKKAWREWWAGARPLLEPAYALTEPAGLEQWMKAWTKGDEATRSCLMRLWNYEARPDWSALLKGADGSEAARQILAELWRGDRLPTETRKAIVEQFLSVTLIEKFAFPDHPAVRELAIQLDSAFPFPANAWVRCACNITIGDREPVLKDGDFASSFSLQDLKKVTSASVGGGSYPGHPTAQALYELQEEERNGRKDGWKVRWKVKPIELRESGR